MGQFGIILYSVAASIVHVIVYEHFLYPHGKNKQHLFLARLNKVHGELLYYPRHRRPQMLKFYVRVFRTSLFPNPLMDLVYIWYDDRYWSKFLFSTIPNSMHDLKVKVTDLELLC